MYEVNCALLFFISVPHKMLQYAISPSPSLIIWVNPRSGLYSLYGCNSSVSVLCTVTITILSHRFISLVCWGTSCCVVVSRVMDEVLSIARWLCKVEDPILILSSSKIMWFAYKLCINIFCHILCKGLMYNLLKAHQWLVL